MRSRSLFVVAFAATLLASAPALADNHSEAVKYFESGIKHRDHGDLEKAANVFRLSIQMEPSIGAYYNLGLINETLNHPREAVDAFRKAEALAKEKGDPREKDAHDQRTKLLDTHNYVVINVPDEVASAFGLRIVVDGEAVPQGHFNGEVFRPQSAHEITVSATGRKDVKLQARNRQAVTIALGESTTTTTTPPPPPPPPSTPADSQGGWGWQKWTGVGLVGGGVVLTVLGIVAALSYQDEREEIKKEAESFCTARAKTPDRCILDAANNDSPALMEYRRRLEEADSKFVPHTLLFTGAGLFIAGGIILFVTAPAETKTPAAAKSPIRVVPSLTPQLSGLTVVGTF
jgi:hypothetical protein